MKTYMECPICGPSAHRILRHEAETVAWCQDCKRARTLTSLERAAAQAVARSWEFGADRFERGAGR